MLFVGSAAIVNDLALTSGNCRIFVMSWASDFLVIKWTVFFLNYNCLSTIRGFFSILLGTPRTEIKNIKARKQSKSYDGESSDH